METKQSKFIKRLVELVVLLLLIAAGVFIAFLYQNNEDLRWQIEQRDSLIKNKQVSDSIFSQQSEKNKDVVDKYISDCGILINNKEVTTDELVQYLNDQIKKITTLNERLYKLEDSLRQLQLDLSNEKIALSTFRREYNRLADSTAIYKSFYQLAKKNLKADFEITVEENNQRIMRIIAPKDSLSIYRKLYQLAQQHYGINYDVKQEGEYTTFIRRPSRADSGEVLLDIYKDRMYFDADKRTWYVGPAKKDTKKN